MSEKILSESKLSEDILLFSSFVGENSVGVQTVGGYFVVLLICRGNEVNDRNSSDKILSRQNFPPSNEVNDRNSSEKTGSDRQKEEKGFSKVQDQKVENRGPSLVFIWQFHMHGN